MTDVDTCRAIEAVARSGVLHASGPDGGLSSLDGYTIPVLLGAYAVAVEARVKAEIAAIVKQAAGKW